MGSSTDKLYVTHSADDDEDGDDVVALLEVLRDQVVVSDKKMSRSEQLPQKENAFLGKKTSHIKELTQELTVNSDGDDEKCRVNAVERSKQPYTTMTLQQASEVFSKLTNSISLDEVIDDNELDEEEFDLPGIPNRYVNYVEQTNIYAADITKWI